MPWRAALSWASHSPIGREHFYRAILEASAYAVRDITDQMLQMGLPLQEIRVGRRGRAQPVMAADQSRRHRTAGLDHRYGRDHCAGRRDARTGGSGLIDSLSEAVSLTTHMTETRDPDPKTHAAYEEYYQLYRATYFSLLPVFEQAAKINNEQRTSY